MTSLAKRNDNDNLITNPDLLFKFSVDMLVVMTGLLVAGIYLNGFNAFRTAMWSVLTAVIFEDIACCITKRQDRKTHDLYAAATGLAIALMLPATVPGYIAFFASAFAVCAVLIPFGSARKIPFVPAAAGFCFVTVCFPEAVFTYAPISVGSSSPVYGAEGFVSAESFSKMLTLGKSVFLNPLEIISLLMGKNPGPMGTTCMLVLIAVGIYLLLKRKESFLISFSFLAVCALYAALFPRVNSGIVTSAVMELASGSLVFAALILLPDPFTAPSKTTGKIVYGAVAGLICMLLRRYGAYEEPVCFTVLIMNALASAFGDYSDSILNSLVSKGIIKKRVVKFNESAPNDVKEKKKKERIQKVKKSKKSKSAAQGSKEKPAANKSEATALSYDDLLNFDGNSTDSSEKEESKDENR